MRLRKRKNGADMPSTQWGAPITFGWELEGTTLKVLNWYEPGEALLAAISLTRSEWEALNFEARSKVISARLTSGTWGTGALRWSNFVRRADAPVYLQPALKEEADPRTWEVNATPTGGITVDQLFSAQLDVARAWLADTDRRAQVVGFHVHVVFDKPGTDKQAWNGYIASLFTLLNDYAAMKDAANQNENFTSRVVGNSPNTPNDVAGMLDFNVTLDKPLSAGQMGGPQKYNFVGLRDIYGDNKIGFEIREGWTNNWDRFKSFLNRLVGHLGALTASDVHVKRSRPENVNQFSLLDHFQFYDSRPDAPPGLMERLMVEAKELLTPTRDQAVTDQVTLYHRWSRAFIPWENHPAFSSAPGQRELIRVKRKLMCVDLKMHFDKSDSHNKRLASAGFKPTPNINAVNKIIAKFFEDTKIHKYL
ncbi:hypothetical protein FAZ69_15830 [Trinickia terrae]|uniref:Amidoligase enzyme n=1 Tax=Trinickia terrae TaxID=2571161 RepID=A0A4U1I3D2_9BURK|nr:hypothetical protein [Trinickia terrae]TKC87751.1 hypothetical protein FAZ69_15830 [Trinickia terrae]